MWEQRAACSVCEAYGILGRVKGSLCGEPGGKGPQSCWRRVPYMVRPAGMPPADMPMLGFFSRFCSVITAWVVSMMPAMEQALVRPLRVTCSGCGCWWVMSPIEVCMWVVESLCVWEGGQGAVESACTQR